MQFMLLLENAAALVNLHKLYNSLSLFIKSLSNILAMDEKGGRIFQTSVPSSFSVPGSYHFIYFRKSVCLADPFGGLPFLHDEWDASYSPFIH